MEPNESTRPFKVLTKCRRLDNQFWGWSALEFDRDVAEFIVFRLAVVVDQYVRVVLSGERVLVMYL